MWWVIFWLTNGAKMSIWGPRVVVSVPPSMTSGRPLRRGASHWLAEPCPAALAERVGICNQYLCPGLRSLLQLSIRRVQLVAGEPARPESSPWRSSAFARGGCSSGAVHSAMASGGQGLPTLASIPAAACPAHWLALAVFSSHTDGK